MNKKILAIPVVLLLIISVFSGCINEEKEPIDNIKSNEPPEAFISTNGTINLLPDYVNLTMMNAVAYAGDIVTFDAAKSYDPDGDVLFYRWIWEDGTDSEGVKATRKFEIDDIFYLQGLPLIFSIILEVKDDIHSSLLEYRIGIIPKEHIFYFDSDGLKLEKPEISKDKITATIGKLRPVQELNYEPEKSIYIQKCAWAATIYLEKSPFAIVNKLSIIFYDNEGNEITRKEEKIGFITLWMEKTIQIFGSLDKKEEFKSIKLVVYGFSLRDNIKVLYGGEEASQICFDFSN